MAGARLAIGLISVVSRRCVDGADTVVCMAEIRLFASAREAAGTKSDTLPGATVGDILDAAVAKYGAVFAGILDTSAVWCNGDAVERDHPVSDSDEVAVLPPVSGGSDAPLPSR